MNNNLILRTLSSPFPPPYSDTTRGSVLSQADVDNNFIYLKGQIIYSAETNGSNILLKKINGEELVFDLGGSYWTSGSTGLYSIKAINDTSVDATGDYAVAQGSNTLASGVASSSEGNATTALGDNSHTEGENTQAGWKAFNVSSVVNGLITISDDIDYSSEFTSGNIVLDGFIYTYNTINFSSPNFTIQLNDITVNTGLYVADADNLNSPLATVLLGNTSHAEGQGTESLGNGSHAEGYHTQATGPYSHAEGFYTQALASYSHTEGYDTKAFAPYSHAEGVSTQANGSYSHTEGNATQALGEGSHSEGLNTQAGWRAFIVSSVSNGLITISNDIDYSSEFTSGSVLLDNTFYSYNTVSFSSPNFTIQLDDTTINTGSYVSDRNNLLNYLATAFVGNYSHAEGNNTKALGSYSHSEGVNTIASGNYSHAEGFNNESIGDLSHAEGEGNIVLGNGSHVEGIKNISIGGHSHSEGENTQTGWRAFNISSVSNGLITISNDVDYSSNFFSGRVLLDSIYYYYNTINFSSPNFTIQLNDTSINGGSYVADAEYLNSSSATVLVGNKSHSEGTNTKALGVSSHSEGVGTIAVSDGSHAQGYYNIPVLTNGSFVVGNGTDDNNRSNLLTAAGSQVEVDGSFKYVDGNQSVGRVLTTDADGVSTWQDFTVGLTMPSAFTVSDSPATNSGGVINVTGAGIASQYVRGDGTLATLPNISGGGGGQVMYLNGNTSQGTISGTSFYQLSPAASLGANADFTSTTSEDNEFASFITDIGVPGQETIPAGVWIFQTYLSLNATSATANVYATIEVYDGSSFNVLSTSLAENVTNGTSIDLYTFTAAVPEYSPLTPTDRIVIRFYAAGLGGTTTITLHTEDSHLGSIQTTFTTGLSALNGLTLPAQYLVVGSAGNDFSISSATDTHTFNLPTASATKRGALSSADWSTFNNKQDTITLTTTGTSGPSTFVGNVLNVPSYSQLDLFTTGFTYNNNTFTLTNNTGGTLNALVNTVTGLTVNGSISATTYNNLPIDVTVTGFTYNNNTFTLTNNTGGTLNALVNTVTGLTVNGNLTVTGLTVTRSIEPATDNTYVLGSTTKTWGNVHTREVRLYDSSGNDSVSITTPSALATSPDPAWNLVLPLISGATFTLLGAYTGASNTTSTAWFTLSAGTNVTLAQSANVSGGTLTISSKDTFVTGGTYSSGSATFTNNTGGTFTVTGFSTGGSSTAFTGGTVTGATNFTNGLTANTISAATYYNLPLSISADTYWVSGASGTNSIKAVNATGLISNGNYSVAIGNAAKAYGAASYAQGTNTASCGDSSHAEGYRTAAIGSYTHAEGECTTSCSSSHSEGFLTFACGYASHAEGNQTTAIGTASHAEGGITTACGNNSHAEGGSTKATGGASHAEGSFTLASCDNSHAEGVSTTASGLSTHAEGSGSVASGRYSHAEGDATTAAGCFGSHSEGDCTTANGTSSHAEGWISIANGYASHAEGCVTLASGNYGSHAEGARTTASGLQSHAEGCCTVASNSRAHAEGVLTVASGEATHAEGCSTSATSPFSHAEGLQTTASGQASHTEGYLTTTTGFESHAEGNSSKALGNQGHAEGYQTTVLGHFGSHSEGWATTASGCTSHAEGNLTTALCNYSHAEGSGTTASGFVSHAEGKCTVASGNCGSHAEGDRTAAIGQASHAEGSRTIACAGFSHAEGNTTVACGGNSHAEGLGTTASGTSSHAEGDETTAIGDYSHSEGWFTTAEGCSSHAGGKCTYAFGDYSFVHGTGSTASGTSTIVLGVNITGATNNTTYVDNLYIKTNVGVGTTSFGTSGLNILSQIDGVAPTTSPINQIQAYSDGGVWKYRDSSGNTITI